MTNEPLFLIVDLFCGAGGTTTGFVQAQLDGRGIAKVIACVNHDPKAIKSHWRNHPDVKHFEEDIRTLELTELIALVKHYRDKYPNAYLILWASLECTNFSKAKGGQPRDADSRTLADHLDRYIVALDPDYIQIENVVEFMSWGPLDDNGKPVSRKNGSDWLRWRQMINSHGYRNDWKELNSANFGAYTSRNRLFGAFAKDGLPIVWPEPTHAKVPSKFSMHGDLSKWKAVKEVLDFSDEGESIFTRKKPLSDKTLERIYAGLVKYVAKGDTAFISKYFSGRPKGKVNSVDDPAPTITTFGGNSLVQADFLLKYNSTNGETGKHIPPSLEDPAPVVSTQGRLGLVQPQFLSQYYGNGYNTSINDPAPTVTTKDRSALIQPEFFIDKHYGNSSQNQSIDQPAGAILPTDKHRLVEAVPFLVDPQWSTRNGNPAKSVDEPAPTLLASAGTPCVVNATPFIMPTSYDNMPKSVEEPAPTIQATRRHHYIVNPSHGGHSTSTEAPCPVIVARQDKAPLYLVQVENGQVSIAVFDGDSEICIRIKQFMAIYGLVDIKMRMLRVNELLLIQGFPVGYKLEGNQSDQKKFIGNSVVPHVVKAWTEALATKLITNLKEKRA
jgi:DNA (cytosine-5)-methyltransferase 1